MIETASSAESLVFSQVLDFELRELSRGILDKVAEYVFFVVADEDDLFDIFNLGDGFQAVPDDGVTCNIEERLCMIRSVPSGNSMQSPLPYLWDIETQWPKSCSSRRAANLVVFSACQFVYQLKPTKMTALVTGWPPDPLLREGTFNILTVG